MWKIRAARANYTSLFQRISHASLLLKRRQKRGGGGWLLREKAWWNTKLVNSHGAAPRRLRGGSPPPPGAPPLAGPNPGDAGGGAERGWGALGWMETTLGRWGRFGVLGGHQGHVLACPHIFACPQDLVCPHLEVVCYGRWAFQQVPRVSLPRSMPQFPLIRAWGKIPCNLPKAPAENLRQPQDLGSWQGLQPPCDSEGQV